jgi:hypothetical protein
MRGRAFAVAKVFTIGPALIAWELFRPPRHRELIAKSVAEQSAMVAVMRPSRLLPFTKCRLGLCGLQFTERFFPVRFEGAGNKPIIGIDSHISTLSMLRL